MKKPSSEVHAEIIVRSISIGGRLDRFDQVYQQATHLVIAVCLLITANALSSRYAIESARQAATYKIER